MEGNCLKVLSRVEWSTVEPETCFSSSKNKRGDNPNKTKTKNTLALQLRRGHQKYQPCNKHYASRGN